MNIIVAPHPDDEIIGCYEVLIKEPCTIIYTGTYDNSRIALAKRLNQFVDIVEQLFVPPSSIPLDLFNPDNTFYFPHPTYELHPAHRFIGTFGEQMVRAGNNVVFYVTNMTAPFIREVKDPDGKLRLMDNMYPDQKNMWAYDHKYFLFEGYCKWIF